MKGLHIVSWILLIIGGLNWLVFGLSGWDIGQLFGEPGNMVAKIIYVLVGLAAVCEIICHKKCCNLCGKSDSSMPPQAM